MFHLYEILNWWLPGCKLPSYHSMFGPHHAVSETYDPVICNLRVITGQMAFQFAMPCHKTNSCLGAQWLSGRVFDSRRKGRGFEPHRRHYVVSLSKNINPSLVLVQPRKTRPFITVLLLMGRKESNQTNKQKPFPVWAS